MLAGARAAGWFTGMLFLTTFLVGYTDYVAMNDPQLLALALSTLGLWTLVRWWGSTQALATAMVLMLLAGLTKHNMIALPIATFLAVWLESPRRGVVVAVGGAIATGLVLALHLRSSGDPSRSASLLAGRQWKAMYLAQNILRGMPVLAFPLATIFAGAGLLSRRGPDRLLLIYAVMALVMALFTGGGAGVYYNCFFDLAVVSCILTGDHRVPRDAGAWRPLSAGALSPAGPGARRGDARHQAAAHGAVEPAGWRCRRAGRR